MMTSGRNFFKAAIVCVFCSAFISSGSLQVRADNEETVDMYRLYNPATGEHLYTEDTNERDVLTGEYEWEDEGVAWKALKKSDTPVFRLFNRVTGEHYYTADEDEKDELSEGDWNYEGIAWYSDDVETDPVLRMYSGDYDMEELLDYASESDEKNVFCTEHSWKCESDGDTTVVVSETGSPLNSNSTGKTSGNTRSGSSASASSKNIRRTTGSSSAVSGSAKNSSVSAASDTSTGDQKSNASDGSSSVSSKASSSGGHYETVHHDAVTHEEAVYVSKYICNQCGATFDTADGITAHEKASYYVDEDGFGGTRCYSYHVGYVQNGTKTVTDQAAYDEQVWVQD